jgi:NAD(P)-dependent dehydrogenase (short-subunit alcohol dehydrogenase family)
MNRRKRITYARPAVHWRMFQAMWRQRSRSLWCPDNPRLDGKRALVTGGNAGIGLEISRGLVKRGAELIIAARNPASGQAAANELTSAGGKVGFVPLDLADLKSVRAAARALEDVCRGHQLDILIHNAGVWPTRYQQSAQGFEIAFATNVLGHYALTEALLSNGVLAPTARVIVQTGDIYVMAKDCTPDFRYSSALGGQAAYCRSKLGNLWYASELQRRYPGLAVYVAHPGVVASGLVDVGGRFGAFVKRQLLLSPLAGAQTCLLLATQDHFERGGYYHNTLGRMLLQADDPAMNSSKAVALWELLERLNADYKLVARSVRGTSDSAATIGS